MTSKDKGRAKLTLPLFPIDPMASFLSPTFYVLYLLLEVFHETVGVVILPGVAGLEVQNAVARVAAVSEVAEPVVDVVAVGV